MVNKTGVMLLALVLAVVMVLPTAMADGDETMMAENETAFAVLAQQDTEEMFLPDGVEALNPDAVPETDSPTVIDPNPPVMDMNTSSAMNPAEPDAYEPGYVLFPAEGNYIFYREIYTFIWRSDFPGNYVSIGIVPVGVNETNITWMFIKEDRPYDDRLEFSAPPLKKGTYRTVFAIDGEEYQENFFGDTFFIEENQVYVPPRPPVPATAAPAPITTPVMSWW